MREELFPLNIQEMNPQQHPVNYLRNQMKRFDNQSKRTSVNLLETINQEEGQDDQ